MSEDQGSLGASAPSCGSRSVCEPSSVASASRPLGRVGGSRKTAISASATSTAATTAAANPSAPRTSSLALATRSFCEPLQAMLPLSGAERNTAATGKRASNVPSFGTRARSSRPSLSDRLTASLITSGLVCGITPSSLRKLSDQPIRVLAFDMPDGCAAATRAAAFSSLKSLAREGGEAVRANTNGSTQ